MSYTNSQEIVKLPVYKEKVMFISQNQSDYKIEQSYVISASYNGILRLSPNNYNTITETNPVELSPVDENSISYSYSDAIVFDDKALSSSNTDGNGSMLAKKMDADITKRMIIGSDSDGYLVNFRMSDMAVEFDKLGVIGITKTNKLTIYSDDTLTKSNCFTLGNTLMPSITSTTCDTAKNTNLNTTTGADGKPTTDYHYEDYDEIEVKITDEGDNSYILGGIIGENDKREFEFKHSQEYIREVIMEALLSIKSVPTGSIHWFPITYEQYVKMTDNDDDCQYPNKFDTERGKYTDPLIRDYLLCDGRKYKTSEFPELAKILYNETVTYWDFEGNLKSEKNGEQKAKTNDKGEKEIEIPDYFRVPDMRTKFISYCYTKGTNNALTSDQLNNDNEFITAPWNKAGVYTPDNSPKKSNGEINAPHFHFTAYGTYTPYNMKTVMYDNQVYNFENQKYTK